MYVGSSSLAAMLPSHEAAFPGSEVVREEPVEVRRLDDLVREEEIALRPPVLMKIDVQGYEDRVIEGAGAVMDRIDTMIVEMSLVSLYEGQILFELGRFDEAVSVCRAVRERDPESREAWKGLERALRASGDAGALAEFLAEKMDAAPEVEAREGCAFERAVLLEENLGAAADRLRNQCYPRYRRPHTYWF